MPVSIRDIKIEREEREEKLEPVRVFSPAIMRAIDGSVEVPGRTDYVWVTEFSQPQSIFQILNRRVAPVDGLPVKIGFPEKPPFERQVVDIWDGAEDMIGYTPGDGSGMQLHAQSHQYPSESNAGYDPVLTYQPAMQMLKCTASSGLTVAVQSFIYWLGNTRVEFPGAFLDLTSAVPAVVNQSVYVLVYLNTATNTLGTVVGTPTTSPTVPTLPDMVSQAEPSAYVLLENGQTVISTETDVTDARVFLTFTEGGSTGGYPFSTITVDLVDPDADYSDIDSAVAAAGIGDVIEVGPGLYDTTGIALPSSSYLIGKGKGITVIRTTTAPFVVLTASLCRVMNMSILNQATGAGTFSALTLGGSDCLVHNVYCESTSPDIAAILSGISVPIGPATIINCEGIAERPTSYGLHINLSIAAEVKVSGGRFDAELADIFDTMATVPARVILEGAECVNGTVVLSATQSSGHYLSGRALTRPFGLISPEVRSYTGKQFLYKGGFATPLDARAGFAYLLRRQVEHSDANWYELFLDGVGQRLTIDTDTTWTFEILVVGQDAGATNAFSYRIEGACRNDGGTTTLLASTVTTVYEDIATFDARVTADDPNDALLIEVQDSAGGSDTVRWVANVRTSEVSYS